MTPYAEIESRCRGVVLRDEPLAPHTSLGIGGPADLFVWPRDLDDLQTVMALAQGVPLLIMGRGTNLLISDRGFQGVVLGLGPGFRGLNVHDDVVSAEAGLGLQALLHFCAERGLGGIEFVAGIPGTVGGAIKTNAGTATQAIGDRVQGVEVVDRGGQLRPLNPPDLGFRYRGSSLPDGGVVYRVEFKLQESDPQRIRDRIEELMAHRRRTQPLSAPNAGCIFKNPPGDSAGRLIEECGCKGLRVGGAVVSEKHANFILNLGGARFDDVVRLIDMVRERVYRSTGVALELEVEVIE